MNRDALAFFRILPAGAADVGDVSREELRATGAGDWSMQGGVDADDVSCLYPELTEADFEVLPGAEAPKKVECTAVQLIFDEVG